ncbi:carbohydrate-binding domain-containing protein [uncultured Algibacter sp.]|uniref:carbohydrate-binding domain-containing protein n=1 Tax=uncultured Algibacter sp. TaxID=298659 RepID=UPI00262DE916|nr:carbohydrate-binding domain-containing protein [uncultured Algibacter sp.]
MTTITLRKVSKLQILLLLLVLNGFSLKLFAQQYPFNTPNTITASLNVETTNTEPFNNKIIGYNIEGFNTQLQKDFIKLVNPVTIRFPHGVWANFYEWQDDTYQQDDYDNGSHQDVLDVYVRSIKGHIGGIASLNTDRKAVTGGQGYDMMWTYSVNFDDGASSVARAQKDIGLGLEVKAIELGNEHFWKNQRANRTATPALYLSAATEVSTALKAEFPDIKLSIPLGWRRSQAGYNNEIIGDGNYFDAITVHKYLGADPDIPGESNSAYSALLTAKLELAEDVNWVRDNFAPGKPVWLTEWGVSAGSDVHAGACLGLADVYMYMAENQDIYERANWFSFNRILNAMVVVSPQRQPIYPLQKRGYLSTYEIIQDVYRDAIMLSGTVTASTDLTVPRGSVKAVNARATTKNGETKIMAVNLTDKPVEFELKFDDIEYTGAFNHEALVFENLGPVAPVDYFSNQLQLIKQGTGTIILPPLSVSKISGIYLNENAQAISGIIEAESFSSSTALGVATDNDITYINNMQSGDWLEYTVNVLNTNTYNFEFIYASEVADAIIGIEIDNDVAFNDFALSQTASALDFQSSTRFNVPLTKGIHTLRINAINGVLNLDKVNVDLLIPLQAPVFLSPGNADNVLPGEDIEVEASIALSASEIASVDLFVNNVLVRSITSAPFTWGFDGQNDTALENIAAGDYELKLVLTHTDNRTAETVINITSNDFPSRPYNNVTRTIPGIIQFEDYDTGGAGVAFSDSTLGNVGGAYRTGAGEDVDITTGGTGFVVSSVVGNEYTRYTVDVTETGDYEMLVNYRTLSNNSKPFEASILNQQLTSKTNLFTAPNGSTTSGIRKITDGSGATVYGDYTSSVFTLTEGKWVLELKIPVGGAGPTYDYVTINKVGALSIDEVTSAEDFKVYSIPSKNGKFNLSTPKTWKVYSLLGVEVSQGTGDQVDISAFSKGIYILRTKSGVIKRLLYN